MLRMNLQQVAHALGGEVAGNQVLAPGPGHSAKDRSLSIKIDAAAPRGFLAYSHSGDDPLRCKDYVSEKLGLPPWTGNGSTSNGRSKATSYDYHDERGELLFQVVRSEPKDFRQRRPDGNGGWVWSIGETRRVLYRLPEITEAVASGQSIFIAEGEKAVGALVSIGVQATCSPGGAGKWRDEYSQYLKGADIVILPDNDDPGELHAKAVAKSLVGIASRVRVLRLPKLPLKADAFDWVENGGTVEHLWKLMLAAEQHVDGGADEGGHDARGPSLISVCASEIAIEPVEWLWPGRLAVGKHTCLAGEPGASKSQLTMSVSAAVTTGGEWPCREGRAPQGSVIILSAEDGAADTIVPRLHAAGADLGSVNIVKAVRQGKGQRAFNLQLDLALLEKEVERIGDVVLIVIDPVSSYMGKTDSHKNAEVRGVLEPIGEFAERMRVAVLSVTHFSKAGAGTTTKALHRFIGSIAFVGAPRIALAVIEDEQNGRRLLLHAKNNLAPPPQGLAYRIKEKIVGEVGHAVTAPYVVWDSDPVTITANEALAADAGSGADKGFPREEAKDFLQQMLADGPQDVDALNAQAKALGIAEKTLKRARADLGVRATKGDFKGGWSLSLPEGGHSYPKEAT
jgi:putative DNA primase/helicase